MIKTTVAKPSTINPKWFHIDAEGQGLGRLASRVSLILQGKNKPTYTPHVDTGDYVVITNAEKLTLSGKKAEQKVYRHHTLYPGGLKEKGYNVMMDQHPERIIKFAIRGMLPKTKLGNKMVKKLYVYAGEKHNHEAQQPQSIILEKGKESNG